MTRPIRILGITCALLVPAVAQLPPEPSPIPELRGLLQSKDTKVRYAAAERIGTVTGSVDGLPGAAAVPDLLRVFAADPDEMVSEAAAWSLLQIGAAPLGAFEHVAAHLVAWREHGAAAEPVEQLQAVLQAPEQQWPGTAVVHPLVSLLENRHCTKYALGVLAVLGKDALAAVPAIEPLLDDADPTVRWRAAFTLACLGAPATPTVRAHLGDDHPAVRLWTARVLFTDSTSDPSAAKLLLPWIKDERRAVRTWALGAAGHCGAAAAPAVEAVATNWDDLTLRTEAWPMLRALGEHAAPIVPRLEALLKKPSPWQDPTEQLQAIDLLRSIGPRAGTATDLLLALASAPMPPDHHDIPHEAAVAALAAVAPERGLAELLPGVEAPTDAFPADHRVFRFRALGEAAAPALPRLRAMLTTSDRGARARALLALEPIGARALPSIPDLLPLLEVEDEYLRSMAMRVLEAIGLPAAPEVVPVLERLREHAKGNWGTDLIRGAHRFGAAAEPLLVRATTDHERWTRTIAIEQLLLLPARTQASQAVLLRCLDDNDFVVRDQMLAALALPEWREVMLARAPALLASTDAYLRRRGAELLLASHLRPPTHWASWADSDPAARLLDLWKVSQRPPEDFAFLLDRERIEGWIRALANDADPVHRATAATGLGILPSTVSSRLTLAKLAADADAIVRQVAVRALGRHGNAARAELPLLARMLRDADWFVRAAAMDALRSVL